MPTTPHKAAGCRMLPPVSEPIANGTCPLATDAAAPPLLPPGTLLRFQGLYVGWKAEVSHEDPMANSSIFPLPRLIAPA